MFKKIKKQTIIFLIFILIGLIYFTISESILGFVMIGATGKAIVGSYSFPAPTKQGKVIGGCYGECPSGANGKQKTMASSCASGGL